MFETFSDEIFMAWFAGFFDGEGCIYTNPDGKAMEITVANTERDVIRAIHERLGFGIISETTFSTHNWKTKYQWRLRNMPEIHALLSRMRPYLTIKACKADRAMELAASYIHQRREMAERNKSVLEMLKTHRQFEVADAFGLTRQTVATIKRSGGRLRPMGRRRKGRSDLEIRTSVQSHHKDLVKVTTTTKLIA